MNAAATPARRDRRRERLEPQEWLVSLSVVALAVAVGYLSGSDPAMGVAVAVGAAYLVLCLTDLSKGLVAFTLLTFIALLPGFAGPGVNATKGAGAVLAISWLASRSTTDRPRGFASDHPILTTAALLMLAWNALSAVWAASLPPVELSTVSFLLNFALFPIVYAAVRTKGDARNVMLAFVFGAILSAAYGVITQPNVSGLAGSATAASGLDRLSGTIKDPNELATVLAAGVVLSGSLFLDRSRSALLRFVCGTASVLLLVGMFLTLSRGGLVALGAGLIAWLLISSRNRLRSIAVVAVLVGTMLWLFLAVAPPEARDRITRADGGSGRTDIWKVGWRMVEAHPINGVGAGNFQNNSIHYLLAPGQIKYSQYIVDAPAVAHNAYLQVLAETGVIGLGLFLVLIVGSLAATGTALRTFRRSDDHEGELLATGLFVATVSVLAGYFFLADQHSKYLWLLLSLGPALLGVAKRGASRAGALP